MSQCLQFASLDAVLSSQTARIAGLRQKEYSTWPPESTREAFPNSRMSRQICRDRATQRPKHVREGCSCQQNTPQEAAARRHPLSCCGAAESKDKPTSSSITLSLAPASDPKSDSDPDAASNSKALCSPPPIERWITFACLVLFPTPSQPTSASHLQDRHEHFGLLLHTADRSRLDCTISAEPLPPVLQPLPAFVADDLWHW